MDEAIGLWLVHGSIVRFPDAAALWGQRIQFFHELARSAGSTWMLPRYDQHRIFPNQRFNRLFAAP